MKHIWAPWRMEYLKKKDRERGCIFCKRGKKQFRHDYVLHRGKKMFVMLNKYPYTNGHLMIIPYRHTAKLESLNGAETTEFFSLIKQAMRVLRQQFRPGGFNIGINLGRPAGAGIVDHIHLHIVPRWVGDTNYMPLLGEIRLISEHLQETFQRLKTAWRKR